MALKEFNIAWNTTAPGGVEPTAGDQWKIYLDQDLFTADVSNFLIASYVSTIEPSDCEECEGVTTYRVSYDDSQLPTGRTDLRSCDVQDVQQYTCEDMLVAANNQKLFQEANNVILKEAFAALPNSAFTDTFETALMVTAGFWRISFNNQRYWVRTAGDEPIELF